MYWPMEISLNEWFPITATGELLETVVLSPSCALRLLPHAQASPVLFNAVVKSEFKLHLQIYSHDITKYFSMKVNIIYLNNKNAALL